MSATVHAGTLAFLGPSQTDQLSDFQYVEVVNVTDTTAVVTTTGPDHDSHADTLEVPLDVIKYRVVSDYEHQCWPGSYIAHPVALVQTTDAGVDEWAYGVVSGYTASETTDILHIVGVDGPTRLPLTNLQSVIKVDSLNYALQPGRGTNSAALSSLELLHKQDALIAACRKRRTGVPAAVLTSLSVPFSPDELVPLVKPATLQLVHIRRQHIVDFATASRANRPDDLYTDGAANTEDDSHSRRRGSRTPQAARVVHTSHSNSKRPAQQLNQASSDDGEESPFSEDDDVEEVRHMNTQLPKRQSVNEDDDSSLIAVL